MVSAAPFRMIRAAGHGGRREGRPAVDAYGDDHLAAGRQRGGSDAGHAGAPRRRHFRRRRAPHPRDHHHPRSPRARALPAGPPPAGREEPITTAYQIMEARDVNQLPVIEHGRLIGLVTRLDILHELGKLTDPLTGLPRPGKIRQRAAELLQQGQEIVILFIDLDRFRLVNKRFGHVVGDRLITAVAAHLLHATDTAQDLLCRYGGDEFAIVTTRGAEQAEALAETILAGIRRLTLPELEGFTLTASIRLARRP